MLNHDLPAISVFKREKHQIIITIKNEKKIERNEIKEDEQPPAERRKAQRDTNPLALF